MLAFVISLAFALYILGPDAFSRFLLDFSIPRKNVTLTKAEEVYRAVIWSGVSFGLAYLWDRSWGAAARLWDWNLAKIFFAGLYSEEYFRDHQSAWFHSAHVMVWANLCLLWRLYFVVLVLTLTLNLAIRFYADVREWVPGQGRCARVWRAMLAAVVLPRIAPWHVLLSRRLLREDHLSIHLDVLTKMNILYQGQFVEKNLGADGTLVGLTLANPKRFRREEYLDDRKSDKNPSSTDYWKPIPTNMFIIMGSEIHSINVRYAPNVAALKRTRKPEGFTIELEEIREALKSLRSSQSDPIKLTLQEVETQDPDLNS